MEKVSSTPDQSGTYFVDTSNNQIVIEASDIGKQFQIVLQTETDIATFGAIDTFEVLTDGKFQGEIISTEEPFILEIPRLTRISNPTYSAQNGTMTLSYAAVRSIENDRKPFRIYSKSVKFDTGDDILTAEIFFADIPEEWVAGSILTLAGVVSLTSNPDEVPVETLFFTSVFDFATPGTETIIFQTNPDGTFAISYQVDPALAEGQSGFLTVTLNETGQVLSLQPISTPDPVLPQFTAAGLDGDVGIGRFITISGEGVANENVTLSSTGLNGEFDGDVAEVRLDGTWSVEGQIPLDLLLEGTSVSVTATHSNAITYGFTPQVLNANIIVGVFTPEINHQFTTQPPGYVTGFPMQFQDNGNYRENTSIGMKIESNTLVFFDDTVSTNSDGDLIFIYTIPISEQGKALTYTFTEIFTTQQVIQNDTAPQFDPVMQFTVDNGQGSLQAGEDSITGTFNASINYKIQVTLYDEEGNVAGTNSASGDTSSGTAITDNWSLNIDSSYLSGAGDPYLELTDLMGIHVPVTLLIDPIPITAVSDIEEDLEVELLDASSLVVPDSIVSFTITSALNDTVTANIPGFTPVTYNANTTATERTIQLDVPIPTIQPLGSYTATFTTTRLPGFQIDINFDIVDPSLTLNACPASLIQTGNGEMLTLSGEGFPGSTVNINTVGLGIGNLATTVQPNGFWTITFSIPWIEEGAYTITVSSPGDGTFICNGTHEPKADWITPSISLLQGDTGNTALFRGKPLTIYNVVSTGLLETSFSLFTDATGFSLVNIADIPILTPTPESGTYTATEAANAGNFATLGYVINERIPITIGITNPSLTVQNNIILFTNSSFIVSGSTPTNGVYGLSAVGPAETFSLTSAVSDGYTALLETGSEAGSLTLTVSTVFQDPESESFTVSPPTFQEVPTDLIVNNLYDVRILGEDGTLAEIKITSPIDGDVVFVTGVIGETIPGEFSVVFDTTGLTDGVVLTFRLSTEFFAFEPQERFLSGFSSGLPTSFMGEVGGDKGTLRAIDRDVSDLSLAIDSTPINEAGIVADIVSGIDLSWGSPNANNLFFVNYLVESYNSGIGWTVFAETNDNKVTLTDLNLGYRITSIYTGMEWSNPVYLNPGGNTIFAKTVILNFAINANVGNPIIADAPEPPSFFTGFVQADYIDGNFQIGIDSNSDSFEVITPEESVFFTFTTIAPVNDTSLSINVSANTDSNLNVIITPEATPFFTI